MADTNQNQRREQESPSFAKMLGIAAGIGAAGLVAYKMFGCESPTAVAHQRARPVLSSPPPPQRTFDETEAEDSSPSRDPVCSICCNKLALVAEKNEDIHVTPCGHVYCHYCIYRWLQTRTSCPTCMKMVRPSETRRIYLS